jgi:septal ring factor EnvC (AmiA/AmiB activator)
MRTDRFPPRAAPLTVAALFLATLVASPLPLAANDDDERLSGIRDEIERLEAEMKDLEARERGMLGAIERLSAEARLRAAELRRVGLELEGTRAAIEQGEAALDELQGQQERTRRYLEFRLRETYKRGGAGAIRRLARGERIETLARGLSYASWLSERDARELKQYRVRTETLDRQNAELQLEQDRLQGLQQDGRRTRSRLESSRRERTAMLERIRDDRGQRAVAVSELQNAARELSTLVDDLGAAAAAAAEPALDVHKFRGLLDPPLSGRISAGFGSVVHPRFRTEVPHPGLDIEAPAGAPFHAVFDGTVVFAAWLRGYGLTAIVDHGGGVLSVYAHASVLLVAPGDAIARGQELGRVGDTGSLRGPLLYFEMRQDGEAVDPVGWLRRNP